MKELTLKSTKFKIKNTIFEVVGTSFGEDGVFNAIDTVKNLKTGNKKTYRRADLIILVEKHQAKWI
jgi:hypothetical protein